MRQGLERLRENKLAVVGCVALVAALTALGIWTNNTAERQGDIERIVRVQQTEVVLALCNQPYTSACLRRAVNIVKTCLTDEECAGLLGVEQSEVPSGAMAELPDGVAVVNGVGEKSQTIMKGPNSSREKEVGARGAGPPAPSGGGKGKGDRPPVEPAPAPPASPASGAAPASGTVAEGPSKGKGQEQGQGQGQGGGQGLVPGATEAAGKVLECVGRLDVGCSVQEIVGKGPAG